MSFSQPPSRLRAATLLAALALASSCDSPTGPRPADTSFLSPGVLRGGTIRSTTDTAHYTLDLSEGHDVVIYFMVKGATLRLTVTDASGRPVSWAYDGNNTTAPQRAHTTLIQASGGRYAIDVTPELPAELPSDYEIRVVATSHGPEHVAPTLTVGPVVRGEDLAHTADVDSFTVTTTKDQLVQLLLRKTTANQSVVTARVFPPPEPHQYIGGVTAQPRDTVLGSTASIRFTLFAGKPYVVYVYYDAPDTARTGYELQIHPIDLAPEAAKAALAMGDTVSESIDYAGDIDTYTLSGTPGARFNLFLEAGGTVPRQVEVSVDGLTQFPYGPPAVRAGPGGPPLAENALGVCTLPPTGKVTLTVHDANEQRSEYTGPYRFLAYPIDPRPEGSEAALSLDEPTTSRVDMLGDVDEFTLTLPTDTIVDLIAYASGTGARPLAITLRDAQDFVVAQRSLGYTYSTYPPSVADSGGLGAVQLAAGSYRVQVEPVGIGTGGYTGTPGTYVGDYRLLARTAHSGPESHSAVIAIGDTVRGERIDHTGDVDRYRITLAEGDSIYFEFLDGTADSVPLSAAVTDPAVYGRAGGPLVVAPRSGEYVFEVRGASSGANLPETGPYAFRVGQVRWAPEDRSPSFALGDTVRSAIDIRGEGDEFILTAPAGITVGGTSGWEGTSYGNVQVVMSDPVTGAVLDSAHIKAVSLGHVVVPANGTLMVRVREPRVCEPYGCYGQTAVGSYHFVFHEINRGPESVAPTFALGDTVSGESLDYPGDIDEFTFTAAAADTVTAYFQTPNGSFGGVLRLKIVEERTGTTVATFAALNPVARLEDNALTGIGLPTAGTYRVVIEGDDRRSAWGEYRLRIAR